jgi:CelD/BcsL family acetyltransferase involved in cellulose biosynthesis
VGVRQAASDLWASRPLAATDWSAETLSDVDAFLELEPEWRALLAASRSQNPFLRWEWISVWVRHFSRGALRTVVVRAGRQVVAIAPFHRNVYQLFPGVEAVALQLCGPREYQHLFELREILVRPGHERAAIVMVLEHLSAAESWDWIEVAGHGVGLEAWDEALRSRPAGLLAVDAVTDRMPLMSLKSEWHEQRRALKRNVKESIRHCYNVLIRDAKTYQFSIERNAGGADAAIDRFLDLHHQRAMVRDHVIHQDQFDRPVLRTFLKDAARSMLRAGRLEICELTVGDEVVASRICMLTGGTLYLYYSGFDPSWWRYSVMTLLVTERIRQAIGDGVPVVNFSPGMDQSKSRWKVTSETVRAFSLLRPSASAHLHWRLLRLRKAVTRSIRKAQAQAWALGL